MPSLDVLEFGVISSMSPWEKWPATAKCRRRGK